MTRRFLQYSWLKVQAASCAPLCSTPRFAIVKRWSRSPARWITLYPHSRDPQLLSDLLLWSLLLTSPRVSVYGPHDPLRSCGDVLGLCSHIQQAGTPQDASGDARHPGPCGSLPVCPYDLSVWSRGGITECVHAVDWARDFRLFVRGHNIRGALA